MNSNTVRPDDQGRQGRLTAEQEVVESLFEVITWNSKHEALIRCPGEEHHSSRNGYKDCKLYLNGEPTIYCFHESCGTEIEEATRKLREKILVLRALNRPPYRARKAPPQLTGKPKSAKEVEALIEASERSKEIILNDFSCTLDELRQSSPFRIPDDPVEQFKLQLRTLPQNKIIFHGGLYDSGKPEHERNFAKPIEFIDRGEILGEFISQSAFRPGTYQRRQERMTQRIIYTVECDSIDDEVRRKLDAGEDLTEEDKRRNKEKSCAVFRWLREDVGLEMLSVVDSTNKSLHSSFTPPNKDWLAQLKHILPALGCDPKMMSPGQITRAAGARSTKTGQIQELLYCDPLQTSTR